MLSRSVRTVLLGAVTLAACGTNQADVEEIKKGQKDILSKLDNLDKAVQQVKAAAPAQRPQIDPNKVYNIPISRDRKSTRLNSSHVAISYAVFCLKKKKSTKHA